MSVMDESEFKTVADVWYDKDDEFYALLQTVPDAENRSQSFRLHAIRADTLPRAEFTSGKTRTPLNFGTDEFSVPEPENAMRDFFIAFMFAFLGGLVLNVMPCVLPILSLKALSVAELTGSDAKAANIAGWAYTAGVLLCFQILAIALILLRATGLELGWGFQLQDPIIVSLLALLVVVVGFNFSGLFEIRGSFANLGGLTTKLTNMRGMGDFFTGLLAVLIASPCTVPRNVSGRRIRTCTTMAFAVDHFSRPRYRFCITVSAGYFSSTYSQLASQTRRLDGDVSQTPCISTLRHSDLVSLCVGLTSREYGGCHVLVDCVDCCICVVVMDQRTRVLQSVLARCFGA